MVVVQFFVIVIMFLLHSPQGGRVRSRVELTIVLDGQLDLTTFEYKTGKFYDGEALPIRVRNRLKVPAFFIA